MTVEEWYCPEGHYRFKIGAVDPNMVDDAPLKMAREPREPWGEKVCFRCGKKLVRGEYVEEEKDSWTTRNVEEKSESVEEINCPECGSNDLSQPIMGGLSCNDCDWQDFDYFMKTSEGDTEMKSDEGDA